MAARKLKPFHQDSVKDKIQCNQLINFLQQYGLTGEYNGIKDIHPKRIDAAIKLLEFRLSKPTPDIIQAIQINMLPPALAMSASQLLANIGVSNSSVSRETLPENSVETLHIQTEHVSSTLAEDSYTLAEDAPGISEEGE